MSLTKSLKDLSGKLLVASAKRDLNVDLESITPGILVPNKCQRRMPRDHASVLTEKDVPLIISGLKYFMCPAGVNASEPECSMILHVPKSPRKTSKWSCDKNTFE